MKRKFIIVFIYIIFSIFIINNSYAIEQETKEIERFDVNRGFYRISICTDQNKVFDVVEDSKKVNALVGIWGKNNNANQRFKIEKTTKGNYKIIAVSSQLTLEIDGENIKQKSNSNNNTQEWIFETAENGYCYIKSANNGLYLTANGENLKANAKDENKIQKFKLEKTADLSCGLTIPEGYYMIKSNLDESKVLDIDGTDKVNEENIHLWSKNGGSNQVFQVIYDKNNKNYKIKSVLSNKFLDIYMYSVNNGANVQTYSSENVDWQKWVINQEGSGIYTISSVWNGLYLNVTGNSTKNGTNIEVYSGNGGKSQKFSFEEINIPESTQSLASDGFYQIASVSNNNLSLDVLEASKNDKAIVGIYSNNGNANQRFKIRHEADGYYSIENVNSGLFVEVDALEVKQRKKDNNTYAQDWILQNDGNGNYYIISRSNGMYLTYNGGNNLKVLSKNGKNTQKFKLNKKASLTCKNELQDGGYYIIKSALNQNKAIDIEGASIDSEANAILWSKNSRNNQKFKITYNEKEENYTITSVRSKKALDVAWAGKENTSNIQQFTSNGGDNQKWIIEKNADNTFSIISVCNGLYVDLPYSSTKDGTNVELYSGNGGKNQKFIFELTQAVEGTKTISNGFYKIKTNLNANRVLDIGDFSKKTHTNVALWESNNGYNQRYKITYRDNGTYIIQAVHSKLVLDIGSNNSVEQDNLTYDEEQEWIIKANGNGAYNIISAHNGLYWNIENNDASLGRLLKISSQNGNANQKFSFEKVEVEEGTRTISDGTYQIVTVMNENKVLDIAESANYAGANLGLWDNSKHDNQKFKVAYQGNGYYKIFALHSGKAIAVQEAGNSRTVDVKQYDVSDSLKQDWIIKSAGNGCYNIISACNGLYLDVYGATANGGENIEVYTKNGGQNQKFKFKVPFEIRLEQGTYGSSGLQIKGDSRGSSLKYYKIGNGPNVFFGTFAVHGWEDEWSYDGQELTKIAETFKDRLISMQDESLANKWTIYLFPSVNPDGEYHGYTHNGPGRTSLYSAAPGNKGIDINRCWSVGYSRQKNDRNYNGTESFQAYEARALRDFLLSKRATNGQTVLVDLHGWLNETIGDGWIGSVYRSSFGMSKHISTYGQGYLVNWARSNLGYGGRAARSCLVELPTASGSWQVSSWGLADKYINATLQILRQM